MRRFSISRENGMSDKNGRPYFFEWIKELPDVTDGDRRKFETRRNSKGEARYYELFGAISGHLTRITREEKDLPDGREYWLCLYMSDGPEDYKIEVGQIDGRYSLDIMKRLLDPAFRPSESLRLSPFAMSDKDTGKQNIGLSAYSGVDGKLAANRDAEHLSGITQPATATFQGKTLWDYTPVADWLWEKVCATVAPNLPKVPGSAASASPARHPDRYFGAPATNAIDAAPVETDDLPF